MDDFGPCADNKVNCLGVLDGTFVPHHHADPFAGSLLEKMVQLQSLRDKVPINCIPCPEESAEAWHKQKDITGVLSGVPSNANQKCCAFDPTLNEINTTMRTAPLEFGFTPKKWLFFDDVEIMKKAIRINVDKMRLIMLMHPEYQINNKNIGRKVLANAEICNEVTEEQHGSRKNHQAGLLLLNKVLVGNLFCLTKFSGCYAMNDAKGCYDRIDHNFAILTLMFFGVPWIIARTLFLVLQRASHSIKTGYGVFKTVYDIDDPNNPMGGIGQGNGI